MTTDAIRQYSPAAAQPHGRGDIPKVTLPAAAAQQAASVEVASPEPNRNMLDMIAKDLQQSLSKANTGLQFSVDNSTGKTIVKVVHEQSGEVIRQIPSEEMLSIARNIGKMQGLLLEKKA